MINYVPPDVKESIGKIVFTWPDMEIKVVADRISDAGTAELWFYHQNGTGDSLLHTAKANLLSTTTMGQIAKRMSQHSEDIPWQQVLTYISSHTMELQRQGEPSELLEPDMENIIHPGYYVEPIVLKGSPSVIYGDKGVNKTTFCLALLGIIETNYTDSPTELVATQQAKVGLLDWESNQSLTKFTTARLIKGSTIPFFRLPYLRCKQPLVDEIERIDTFIRQYSLDIVLIDSLGQAAGSDKFDSAGKGSALKFFECLRRLNVTPLIIAQNAKGEEGKKTIYGSTYFTYYSRNIFELKAKQDEMNENIIHLALLHQESNYSKRFPASGFCVTYTDTAISIVRESLSLSEFFEKASQTKDLLEYLKSGAKNRNQVSAELKISLNHADQLFSRLKKRKLIQNIGTGLWSLVSNENVP